jgi:VanZ family protein
MLLPLRHPRFWLVLGWGFVALATLASLVPIQKLPTPPGLNDKLEHVVGYALLALWFAGIYPRSRYPWIAGSLLVMGLAIEWLQGAMHWGRSADFRDLIANITGIAVGLSLAWVALGGWAQRIEAWTRRS